MVKHVPHDPQAYGRARSSIRICVLDAECKIVSERYVDDMTEEEKREAFPPCNCGPVMGGWPEGYTREMYERGVPVPEILGIPVVLDASMPPNQIRLKDARGNVVGAAVIADLPKQN